MNYINLNGRFISLAKAYVSHDNRAFRYGYGLFETLLFSDGQILLEHYHWQRLMTGIAKLRFNLPRWFTTNMLHDAIVQTVRKNDLEKLCRVRLQLFAGSGGLYDTPNYKPEFIIECFPLNASGLAWNENGLRVGIAHNFQKSADSLSNLKSCSALIYAMAARTAKEQKWNDALILNTQHHIIESTIANLFWIKDNTVYTPPLTDGCVAGVMRQYLLDTLPQQGIAVTEQSLTTDTLQNVQEMFLTNAIRRIRWVGDANGKTLTGNYTHHIYQKLFT